MRRFKIYFRFLAQFLSLLVLLQSCNIYRAGNISLEKAVEKNSKVKITTERGNKIRFKRIEKTDSKFYGFTRRNSGNSKKLQKLGLKSIAEGKFYKFGLETLNIDKVQAKNYSLSTIATIVVSIIGLFVALGVVAAATWDGLSPW